MLGVGKKFSLQWKEQACLFFASQKIAGTGGTYKVCDFFYIQKPFNLANLTKYFHPPV